MGNVRKSPSTVMSFDAPKLVFVIAVTIGLKVRYSSMFNVGKVMLFNHERLSFILLNAMLLV